MAIKTTYTVNAAITVDDNGRQITVTDPSLTRTITVRCFKNGRIETRIDDQRITLKTTQAELDRWLADKAITE